MKKNIVLLLTAVMGFVVLAGCAGGTKNSTASVEMTGKRYAEFRGYRYRDRKRGQDRSWAGGCRHSFLLLAPGRSGAAESGDRAQ